jgi:decaprenylphospho-beta-D-erythro-pentofuranosid-2-ulose 2-reductase
MSTALILGARSDIAQALAHRFAREGWNLILAARGADTLEDACRDLALRYRIDARPAEFDALRREGHADWFGAIAPTPDLTVCVFGYLGDADKARRDEGEANRILATNYNGAVSILDAAAQAYEELGRGAIIGISSVAGDRGRQSNYHYGSAKAGLSAYLSGLRNRLAPAGIPVLTVKPGFVVTRMTEGMDTPASLTASPQQVADTVFRAFLKQRSVVYTLWPWRWIMLIIRAIPEPLFKRLKL